MHELKDLTGQMSDLIFWRLAVNRPDIGCTDAVAGWKKRYAPSQRTLLR